MNPTVATLPLVRRIFFILLLAILPTQFAWAAATGYCRHETGDATKHFGHHEHQHRATEDGASSDTQAASSVNAHANANANADSDCAMCQLSVAQPVPSATTDVQVPGTDPPRFAYGARYDSYIPSGPDRPDRNAPTPAVRFGGAVVIGALLLA